ncbi:unnamed protein product, partial [Linum tenue]
PKNWNCTPLVDSCPSFHHSAAVEPKGDEKERGLVDLSSPSTHLRCFSSCHRVRGVDGLIITISQLEESFAGQGAIAEYFSPLEAIPHLIPTLFVLLVEEEAADEDEKEEHGGVEGKEDTPTTSLRGHEFNWKVKTMSIADGIALSCCSSVSP